MDSLSKEQADAFNKVLEAMSKFRKVFGRCPNQDVIAEFYVAYALGLRFPKQALQAGYDLVDGKGARYQVKHRAAANVDLNNFDFDFLILVRLNEEYQPQGLWRLSVATAEQIFVERPNFRRFQATTAKVIANATALELRPWIAVLPCP